MVLVSLSVSSMVMHMFGKVKGTGEVFSYDVGVAVVVHAGGNCVCPGMSGVSFGAIFGKVHVSP